MLALLINDQGGDTLQFRETFQNLFGASFLNPIDLNSPTTWESHIIQLEQDLRSVISEYQNESDGIVVHYLSTSSTNQDDDFKKLQVFLHQYLESASFKGSVVYFLDCNLGGDVDSKQQTFDQHYSYKKPDKNKEKVGELTKAICHVLNSDKPTSIPQLDEQMCKLYDDASQIVLTHKPFYESVPTNPKKKFKFKYSNPDPQNEVNQVQSNRSEPSVSQRTALTLDVISSTLNRDYIKVQDLRKKLHKNFTFDKGTMHRLLKEGVDNNKFEFKIEGKDKYYKLK
ncbi:DNA topoisomerase 3-alpha [Acrasis kona]|uniref:DNA topoisomerase 3-alpha n=1 Tax=Acrasis kona TaxID=1008807 RepID=A0AAW2Z1D7_9EUKA